MSSSPSPSRSVLSVNSRPRSDAPAKFDREGGAPRGRLEPRAGRPGVPANVYVANTKDRDSYGQLPGQSSDAGRDFHGRGEPRGDFRGGDSRGGARGEFRREGRSEGRGEGRSFGGFRSEGRGGDRGAPRGESRGYGAPRDDRRSEAAPSTGERRVFGAGDPGSFRSEAVPQPAPRGDRGESRGFGDRGRGGDERGPRRDFGAPRGDGGQSRGFGDRGGRGGDDRGPRRDFGAPRGDGGQSRGFGDRGRGGDERGPRRDFGAPRGDGGQSCGFGDRGGRGGDERGPRRDFGAPRGDGGQSRGFGDRGGRGGDERGPRRDFGAPRGDGGQSRGFGDRGPRRDFGAPRGDRFEDRGERNDRPRFDRERVQRPFERDAVPYEGAQGTTQGSLFDDGQDGSGAAERAASGERLNKRLGDMRLCSRREADDWISNGWVLVNGEPAVLGQRVKLSDEVTVDERAKVKQAERVTILINKPMGYVSAQAEDGHEPAASLINAESRWRSDMHSRRFASWQVRGLAPAGRLDIDSVGLLVLTQDGRVARDIIGEDSEVDKEYLVRVQWMNGDTVVERDVQAVFPEEQLARLRHGLELDGKALLPAEVEWENPEQLRFVLREGKKRQIRRMCEQVGLKVVGLKRIRIGGVTLGNLPTGQWRFLGPHERF